MTPARPARYPALRHRNFMLIWSGLLFCGMLIAFALSRWFWVGVALLVAAGVSSTVFTTMIATLIQLTVPGELRGRVMSLYAVTLIGLPSLGSLGTAALATALGSSTGPGWAGSARTVLELLGIAALTDYLGSAAGGPRAVVLGALVLLMVVLVSAPVFMKVRAPARDRGDAPATASR